MRVVTTPDFCKACTEGLWLSLLRRVTLIDGIQETCERHAHARVVKTLNARLVPLAQFRDTEPKRGPLGASARVSAKESYTILWAKDGESLPEFTNKTVLTIDGARAVGTYTLHVQFATDEVRVDKDKLLASTLEYTVTEECVGDEV